MGGNHSTVFKGLAHLDLSHITSWWPPAATSSHSSHCSPLSPARAFSCLLYCWVPLSINHLTTTVSDLSHQIARNVLHLSPSGFMPCSSNMGEKNNSAVHSAEMHGGSTRRKVLAWTCGSNLAFFLHCIFVV